MLRQIKLRIGAGMIILGSLLAVIGEIVNLWSNNPMQGDWFLPMILVASGALILLYGFNMYAQLSDDINILGIIASGLLLLGALTLVIGIIAVDVVVIPTLAGIASNITTAVNTPGNTAQNVSNSASSALNTVINGTAGLFGQNGSGSDVPSVQIPQLDGLSIVNNALLRFHLPPFATITHLGHFCFSGGPLIPGCLLLGFALLRIKTFPRIACYALITSACFNLISQIFLGLPALSNITAALLFIALTLLGISILFPQSVVKVSQNLTSLMLKK